MATRNVELSLKGLLEDLDNGMTWYKRDDQGYGSIQEKYSAKDFDIAKLRLNPKLKDVETNITIFNLIDDTDESNTTNSTRTAVTRTASSSDKVQQVSHTSADRCSDQSFFEPADQPIIFSSNGTDYDSLSAFADL